MNNDMIIGLINYSYDIFFSSHNMCLSEFLDHMRECKTQYDGVVRYKYDPFTGDKIPWEEIEEEIKEIKKGQTK